MINDLSRGIIIPFEFKYHQSLYFNRLLQYLHQYGIPYVLLTKRVITEESIAARSVQKIPTVDIYILSQYVRALPRLVFQFKDFIHIYFEKLFKTGKSIGRLRTVPPNTKVFLRGL